MKQIGGKRLSENIKAVIVVSTVLVALLCGFVIVFQLVNNSRPENNSIIVYKKGNESIVRIGNMEKIISDASASEFKCDEDSGRVFFTVNSAYSDGLYDLYYIEKHRSELHEPKIIDIGVQNSFDVVSGNVYYLKKNIGAGAFDGCICDIDKGKIETFSGNVEDIFALEGSKKLFFTKMHGENRVLYEYFQDSPREICRDIVNIFGYNKTDKPHVIYEKKSLVNSGMTELYVAYADSEPEMICDSTYLVMYDDYVPSGNLYYFTSAGESVSWSYVIADQYEAADSVVTKPDRKDFFSFFGVSAEYNKALKEYQDKLVRDEIRTALNETMENEDFAVPIFSAYAYNSEGTFKIAENIDPNRVYTVSAFGEPKIIFESTDVLPSDTDMNTLVEIAQRSSMSEVISYARSIVGSSVKSKGMAFAAYGSEGAVSYELGGYDKTKTLFSFSRDGARIFAFVRDSQGERLNLFTNSLGVNLMPSAEIGVDTGVSSYRFLGDSVLYLKSDLNKNSGDIFSYNGSETVKLSNAASAFTVENSEDIIILKNHNMQAENATADYYFYSDSEEELIGKKIVVESFKYNQNGNAAFISDQKLLVHSGGRTVEIADGVTEILLLK